jgi:WD40 repeat protein
MAETCIQLSFVKTWNVHQLRDTPLGEASSTLRFDVHAPFYSAHGDILVVFYSLGFHKYSLQVWNNATGKQVAELKGDDSLGAFSPDSQLLAIHRVGSTILYPVDALQTGSVTPVATLPDKDKPVKELAFNPDGTILYVMSDNRLWLYGLPGG